MNSIIENFNKAGSFYKFNGIVESVKKKIYDEEIISNIKSLKSDNSQIAGHSIAEYSIAALHVLGVEQYTGSNEFILDLIKTQFSF